MKKNITILAAMLLSFFSYGQDLIVTGVFDGPLPGGVPKVIELYAVNDISDLSTYGVGSANNGDGSDGIETNFEGSATSGDFIYVASEDVEFNNFFGFAPTFVSDAASINGDDAIEVFANVVDDGTGNLTGDVIDIFGDIDVDGTDQAWEYLDGWAYRIDDTGPDGSTFDITNWNFSGIDENDDDTTQGAATNPWPLGTYSKTLSVLESTLDRIGFYPNPASDTVHIRHLGTAEVYLYTVTGQKVKLPLINDTVDISNLTPGVYIIDIFTEGLNVQEKLIVQ